MGCNDFGSKLSTNVTLFSSIDNTVGHENISEFLSVSSSEARTSTDHYFFLFLSLDSMNCGVV